MSTAASDTHVKRKRGRSDDSTKVHAITMEGLPEGHEHAGDMGVYEPTGAIITTLHPVLQPPLSRTALLFCSYVAISDGAQVRP